MGLQLYLVQWDFEFLYSTHSNHKLTRGTLIERVQLGCLYTQVDIRLFEWLAWLTIKAYLNQLHVEYLVFGRKGKNNLFFLHMTLCVNMDKVGLAQALVCSP